MGNKKLKNSMGYEYDVFISYRRKNLPKRWLEEVFLPLFSDHLQESLGGRPIRIFRDEEGIESGMNWSLKIKRALATSRCIVPILLPSYFHSEWCTKEFAVIHKRQEHCGFSSIQNPHGLIIPIKIRDGLFFPEAVKALQIFNLNDFYRVGSGIEGTELYILFQNKLIGWIDSVANAINRAPEWNEDWLKDEWLEIECSQFRIDQDFVISQPML